MMFAQTSSAPVFVYVTSNGQKYHKEFCHTIKNSKKESMTKENAIKAGYTPCKICNP